MYDYAHSRPGFGDASGAGAAIGTVVAPGVGTAVGSFVGSVFHSSAAGPNTDAAKAVLPMALAGNLSAVACIVSRASLNTVTSAAPWKAALEAVERVHPEYIAAAQPYLDNPPGGVPWWKYPPEQVASAVQANARYASAPNVAGGVTAGAGGVPGSPNQPGGGQILSAGLAGGNLTTLALIGLGAFLLSKIAGGARRRR